MNNLLYNKKTQYILQMLSVIAIIILIISSIHKISLFMLLGEKKQLIYITINFLVAIIFFFVIFFPKKYDLIAIACIIYFVEIFLNEPDNSMGTLMFVLAMIIFYIRGFFIRHAKVKIVLFSFFFLALLCSRLRFGIHIFCGDFINIIGYTFVFLLGIFFICGYMSRNTGDEKILNVAKFPGLKESDAEMLRRVLDNQQYKVIAIDLKRKEGSVRNRLNRVYDILGVGDRVGFITSYKGFEVSYVPDPESAMNEESDEMESPEAESSVLLS